jgi:hypothetical protein
MVYAFLREFFTQTHATAIDHRLNAVDYFKTPPILLSLAALP